MTILSNQITVSSSTATQLIILGSSAGDFTNVIGTVTDPVPSLIQNIDASITIYLGGSGVTTSNGFPLIAGATVPITWLSDATSLFGLAASGSPKVAILMGRQD